MNITDIAPSDYHLFRHLKTFLAGQGMRSVHDTKHVLQDWLKGLTTNFFEEGIQMLFPRNKSALIYMSTK